MSPAPYVGRFAPSPTGPLHFGSLLAACASYLEARRNGGRWLLRVENIDPPREQPGASEDIVRVLDEFGFEWDGPVFYQSESKEAHLDALDTLEQHLFRCDCSRRVLADEPVGALGTIYPGTCREREVDGESAIRVHVYDTTTRFTDRLQGPQSMDLARESGDFVVLRRDGLVAYHLAVVVDDALHGVTDIVRGIDLMPSTHRQVHLQQLLGVPTPGYAHIPVAVHPDGDKLSKLTGAAPIDSTDASGTLVRALETLRQAPPDNLRTEPLAEVWRWALAHWNMSTLAGLESVLPAGRDS